MLDTVGSFSPNLIEGPRIHSMLSVQAFSYVQSLTLIASDQLDEYQYGCIFCAAQGQTSVVHDRIDHLMLHIISKHRSSTITPDVKAKTKCVIGTVVNQGADWDINIPVSNSKSAGMAADELLMSASRFFHRRRAKRP
jgi:hypothetical protein